MSEAAQEINYRVSPETCEAFHERCRRIQDACSGISGEQLLPHLEFIGPHTFFGSSNPTLSVVHKQSTALMSGDTELLKLNDSGFGWEIVYFTYEYIVPGSEIIQTYSSLQSFGPTHDGRELDRMFMAHDNRSIYGRRFSKTVQKMFKPLTRNDFVAYLDSPEAKDKQVEDVLEVSNIEQDIIPSLAALTYKAYTYTPEVQSDLDTFLDGLFY